MSKRTRLSDPVRCAIYCRKSVSDDSEFTSIDAQREACESYVLSQRHAGWVLAQERYDDMGFSGGNLQRPAMKKLLSDVESGAVDIIVVHKVDRLSRSLIDFARIADLLHRAGASFVSITQQIDTSTPHGKLLMNQLLLFAEFERDMISDRTRTKMAAARKRGQFTGGFVVLGYDRLDGKLLVNQEGAERVKQIFRLYIELGSLTKVVREINRRGWRTKRTQGKTRIFGDKPWTKTTLHKIMTNVTYMGKVKYKDGKLYAGQHEAIIEKSLWNEAKDLLTRNGNGGSKARNKLGALLRGLLYCEHCDEPMIPGYTQKGNRRIRYYVCQRAQQIGWSECPVGSISANRIEQHVVEKIRAVTRDPALLQETLRQAEKLGKQRAGELRAERSTLVRDRGRADSMIRRLLEMDGDHAERLAEFQEQIELLEARIAEVDASTAAIEAAVNPDDVAEALQQFHGLWGELSSSERARLMELIVERIWYDGTNVRIEYRGAAGETGQDSAEPGSEQSGESGVEAVT